MNKKERNKIRKKWAISRFRIVVEHEQLQADLWREYIKTNPEAIPGEDIKKLLKAYPPVE